MFGKQPNKYDRRRSPHEVAEEEPVEEEADDESLHESALKVIVKSIISRHKRAKNDELVKNDEPILKE